MFVTNMVEIDRAVFSLQCCISIQTDLHEYRHTVKAHFWVKRTPKRIGSLKNQHCHSIKEMRLNHFLSITKGYFWPKLYHRSTNTDICWVFWPKRISKTLLVHLYWSSLYVCCALLYETYVIQIDNLLSSEDPKTTEIFNQIFCYG